jgi:hypothetical protein
VKFHVRATCSEHEDDFTSSVSDDFENIACETLDEVNLVLHRLEVS